MRRFIGAAALLAVSGGPAAASGFERMGDVGQVALPAAAVVAALERGDGAGARRFAAAFGVTLALVHVLKPAVARERPDGGAGSFPSGHAASAFTAAAFLERRYGPAWGLPAYAAAAVVAASRVEARRHWTSDVVAGAALGVAANLVATRRWRGVAVAPLVASGSAGCVLELSW